MASVEKLISAKNCNEEVIALVEQMIEYLRVNNTDAMFQVLVVMTHKMDSLIENISEVQELLTERIEIEAINDVLGELIESVQNKDYVLLTDLLEYEILEKMNEWYKIITESL